jgi:hypothetical protein
MEEYIVEIYARLDNPSVYKFDAYEEAKGYYDEMSNLHMGDIKISLFKVNKEVLEFQDFWHDED